jgi:oligopeptide transport system permease protein
VTSRDPAAEPPSAPGAPWGAGSGAPGDVAASGGSAVRPRRAEDFAPAARGDVTRGPARPSLSYWKDAWLRLEKNSQAIASLAIVCALVLFTLIGPLLWRVDPNRPELARISEPPRWNTRAEVLAEPPRFEESVLADQPAAPQADGATLPAPASLEVIGRPTVEAVRLRWAHVPGAAGYLVYRSTSKPGGDYLGLPMGEVTAGNIVSFEDGFNLEPRRYWYSVVATNGAESHQPATLEVELTPGISLVDAKVIDRGAKPGDVVSRPLRPFGTDSLGRDLLARMMAGARVSLFIGFAAPFVYILVGVILGGISGYFGGRLDDWLMRFTDFVLALPFLLFMILFKVAFGSGPGESGIGPMLVAMIVLAWTGAARLTRGQVLQLREREFVQASRLLGARPLYLILRHLLPNTLGVILVSLTFAIPSAIFAEAFLSFIGMGVAPPTASWGSMCSDGIKTFLVYPHEFLFPAAAISVTVLAFNLLGDGLRDALDPRMRSVE